LRRTSVVREIVGQGSEGSMSRPAVRLNARHQYHLMRIEFPVVTAEIRRPSSGPISDQQLVLDENGFGHHGKIAACAIDAHAFGNSRRGGSIDRMRSANTES
jgi:hypothetical protein